MSWSCDIKNCANAIHIDCQWNRIKCSFCDKNKKEFSLDKCENPRHKNCHCFAERNKIKFMWYHLCLNKRSNEECLKLLNFCEMFELKCTCNSKYHFTFCPLCCSILHEEKFLNVDISIKAILENFSPSKKYLNNIHHNI